MIMKLFDYLSLVGDGVELTFLLSFTVSLQNVSSLFSVFDGLSYFIVELTGSFNLQV